MKASEVVSARVPKERVRLIEEIAREERVDKSTILDRALESYTRDWKLRKALDSYRGGLVTLSRAAEMAGISIWEMIEMVAERKIGSQHELEDFQEDLKALRHE